MTPRGHEMMTIAAEAFDEMRLRLSAQVGSARLEVLESVLSALTAAPRKTGSGC